MPPQTDSSSTPRDDPLQTPCSTDSIKPPPTSYPHWHDVVAGAAAGLGARVLTAPLDLIKIRRQLESSSVDSNPSLRHKGRVLSTSHSYVDGEWKLLPHLYSIAKREGGLRSLFRGNVAASYLWMGYSVVQFYVYGHASEYLRSHYDDAHAQDVRTTTVVGFTSGAVAGIAGTLLTYPFDLCRTVFAARGIFPIAAANVAWSRHTTTLAAESRRRYSERRAPRTLREFSNELYRQRGWRGFFAGSGPAILAIVPYMGLNFALHDVFVSLHRDPSRENDRGGSFLSGVAGMGAGVISKFLVYPLDTVKKRLQAQAFWGSSVSETKYTHYDNVLPQHGNNIEARNTLVQQKPTQVAYEGMIDCFRQILRREGVAAFYKGLIPSLLKSSVSTGASFWLFTFSKNVLRSLHDSTHA